MIMNDGNGHPIIPARLQLAVQLLPHVILNRGDMTIEECAGTAFRLADQLIALDAEDRR